MHQYFEHMIPDGVDLGLVMPINGALRGLSIIFLCGTQIHMFFPWKGVQWAGACKTQLLCLFRSLL